ncbi:MAG: 16S rRNA (cytosine(1402)-N(4))-methyltransferase RsmH, partial [Planctomycetaceae bacterium]|nr:16S rRNA (cytosine(1402)-N(4))-methyltransferase RsmH [Planctomycetaceae bacterium]
EAPLDMRFDSSAGESVAELFSRISAEELTQLLREYGEEPQARRLAEAMLTQHRQRQLNTAGDLRRCIESVLGMRKTGSHPATRIFQALRIAVNQELEHLERFLSDVLPRRLAAGGIAAIITFHSLEDRMVKSAFRVDSLWENLTRKPLTASPAEVRLNPRSRSAKLRVARRLPS